MCALVTGVQTCALPIYAYVPLDEALSRVVIDFSGRPGLQMHVPYTRATVGGFDVDLFQEFVQGFVNHANVTLHIDNLRGHNTHHQIETVRSEEHTSELQSLMRNSYAVFCLKKKKN